MPDSTESQALRYPAGRYSPPDPITATHRRLWLDELRDFPAHFRALAESVDLDRAYRPGGWTGRQVAHHVVESHMNSYMRFKLALTEDVPTIKPYNEALWAETPDVAVTPVETSLRMLELLHERWLNLLEGLTEDQWRRQFRHPEIGEIRLDWTLGLYAWHSRHHAGHLALLKG